MKHNDTTTGEELIFGGVATDLIVKDTLQFVPVSDNDQSYWQFKMDT